MMSLLPSFIHRSPSLSLRILTRSTRSFSATQYGHFFGVENNTVIQHSTNQHSTLYSPLDICLNNITITSQQQRTPSILFNISNNIQSLLDLSIWLIKRTFQPSIVRKRRKHGFLRRKESVGGRRVLKRRALKGRMRLGGS